MIIVPSEIPSRPKVRDKLWPLKNNYKKMKNKIHIIVSVLITGMLLGCEGFLDERPDKSRLIPDTPEDLQALLDNENELNRIPALGIIGSDDMATSDNGYNFYFTPEAINGYIWNTEIFEGSPSIDWRIPYSAVFISNVVLEKARELNEQGIYASEQINPLMGMALFFRAHSHFHLAQNFAPPFDPMTAGITLGIPIRTNTMINERVGRGTLNQVYDQIIKDLDEALNYLPSLQPIKTRPSRTAVEALLARVYLTMQDYERAEIFADHVLASMGFSLMNFNDLNPLINFPFRPYNSEVIFHAGQVNHEFNVADPNTFIHPEIYASYDELDLRKTLFARQRANGYNFRGNYTGSLFYFGGVALDEVYFIAAEAKIRNGKDEEAIILIDQLLETRYESGAYVSYDVNGSTSLLDWALMEKRKSMLFRGVNWIDLRRLNLDPATARTLRREVNGLEYVLEPNSPNYTYPIPLEEINLNPMEQNVRD